jgi:mRNA interferase MazF
MKRGEIWWAKLPLPAGHRPVVLVSREAAYAAVRTRVNVVEVSTRIRAVPTEVPLGRRDGLPTRCVANADNVAAVPKACLDERIGVLDEARIAELDRALRYAMQLE